MLFDNAENFTFNFQSNVAKKGILCYTIFERCVLFAFEVDFCKMFKYFAAYI